MQITDSVFFISGGASGLGEAVARRAIAGGAAGVVIADLNLDCSAVVGLRVG